MSIWELNSNDRAYDVGREFARFTMRNHLITITFINDSKFTTQNEIIKVVDDGRLHDVLDVHEITDISDGYLSNSSMIHVYFPYSVERITNFLTSNYRFTVNKSILREFKDSNQTLRDYLYDFVTSYENENFLTVFDSILCSVLKHKMGITNIDTSLYSIDSKERIIGREPTYNASDFQPVIRVDSNVLEEFHRRFLSKVTQTDRVLCISSIVSFMQGLRDSNVYVGNQYFRNVAVIISNLIYSPITSEDFIQYNLKYVNNIDYI